MIKKSLNCVLFLLGFFVLFSAQCLFAAPETSTKTFLADLSKEFSNPPAKNRPELRWWLAEGSHTTQTLTDSMSDIQKAGYGGVEVLTLTEPKVDKTLYGWGTEEWNNDIRTILKEANRLKLGVSFTSGPNWQPAIPDITPDSNEASKEIVYGFTEIAGGNRYNGGIPKDTQSVKSYSYKEELVGVVGARIFSGSAKDPQIILDSDSLTDLNNKDHVTGLNVQWVPGGTEKDTYVIIGIWMRGTAQAADSAYKPAYVVSNFGRAGAKALGKYWDSHMLPADILKLIKENGKVDFFQDSLEILSSNGGFMSASNTFWTKDFPEQFQNRRGYSITKYLPLIFIPTKKDMPMNGSNIHTPAQFILNGKTDLSMKVRRDYYQTLTELYQEYLDETKNWCNGHGMKLRAQVSYGETLETSLPIRTVDIPETETFFFADKLDGYRAQAGAAHLLGNNIFSLETSARGGEAYSITVPETLSQIHKAFSGGVNRIIWHGYSINAGPPGIVQWPGYEGIGIMWSERWGTRQPMWQDAESLTGYIGRMQTILRRGCQKTDIGILRLSYFEENFTSGGLTYWKDSSLQDSGYSYEFFAPQLLEDHAVDQKGVLAPEGPAYKAIIVNQQTMPLASAKTLLVFAKKGLKVIFVGKLPDTTPFKDGQDGELQSVIKALISLPTVLSVSKETDAVLALQKLGIHPRVSYSAPGFVNVLRSDSDRSFVYVYNSSTQDISTTVGIEGKGKPYRLDPWTGKISEIAEYQYKEGHTIFKISLKSESTGLYALDEEITEPVYALSTDANEAVFLDNGLHIIATKTGSYTTRLNNGNICKNTITVPTLPAFSTWHLKVEDWHPGEKVTVNETSALGKSNTEEYFKTNINILETDLKVLKPWTQISQIGGSVSGIGTYTSSFRLPEGWKTENGVYLDLGRVFETVSVYGNGNKMLPADLTDYRVDISQALQSGQNEIKIIVTTTLNNRLIALGVFKDGDMFLGAKRNIQEYGLTEPVILTPYTRVLISGNSR